LRFLSASFVFAALALALSSPAAADWFPVPEMATARSGATATLLNDGRVLVVGGRDASGASLAAAEIFDPATKTWSPAASMAIARRSHTATLLADGRVFVFGGFTTDSVSGVTRTPEIYDPDANTWSPAEVRPAGVWDHTATLLGDGRVLVAGGFSSFGCCTRASFIYDPATNTWHETARFMADDRGRHTAALLPGGKVLVTGGDSHYVEYIPDPPYEISRVAAVATAEIFDPATDSWTPANAMQRTRAGHTATALASGKVLVVGGFTGFGSPRAELYDPTSGMWSSAGDGGGARVDHGATLLRSGEVLITGGRVAASQWIKQVALYDPATNSWKNEPSMSVERDTHAVTRLADGRVFVAAGRTVGGLAVGSAEVYEPRRRLWSAAGALASGRHAHTATKLANGKVVVAGGYDNSIGAPLASAQLYDPTLGTWGSAGSLATARSGAAAVRLPNGKVLVAGGDPQGLVNEPVLTSTELYNPDTNSWSAGASMAESRASLTLTLLGNGKVLAAGGYESSSLDGVQAVASAELYDPGTNTWSPADSMAVPRFLHTATLLPDGKVLVTGGSNVDALSLQSAEIYDPLTNEWTTVTPMIARRIGHTATLLPDGRVLVAGGHILVAKINLASAEIYDPGTNTWTAAASLRTARQGHTATLLPSGTVLVAGGGGTETLWSSELYDPIFDAWFPGPSFRDTRTLHSATLLDDGSVLATGGEGLASAERVAPRNVTLETGNIDAPDPLPVGANLSYDITVTNTGSDVATGLTVRHELPERTVLVSVSPDQGRCTGTGPVVCSLGSLGEDESATIDVVVGTRMAGAATSTLRLRHDEGGAGFDVTLAETTTVSVDANGCTIVGTADPETVDGTAGADFVCGYGENDTVNGLAGDDTLAGGLGNDMLDGGDGTDTASYRAATGGVTAEISSGATGADGNDTFDEIENLLGSSARDVLAGDGAANLLDGGGGDDDLTGGGGNDTLIGGQGIDTFNGGAGSDTIRSRDGIAEVVVCDGQDTVDADASDTLAGCSATPQPPPPTTTTDTTAPGLTVVIKARQKLLPALRKGLRASAGCSEACAIQAKLLIAQKLAKRLKLPTVVGRATATLTAAGTTNLVIKFTAKAKRKLAKLRSVRLTAELTAADAAGNAANTRRGVTLRR
jgi:uncharacterized repeat protein (TIGR01451 family)